MSSHCLPFRFALLLAALCIATIAGRSEAAKRTDVSDVVVELPTFNVTDTPILPPPESWKYASIPGFEVLSNTYDRNTTTFMRDFQLLQQVVGVIWPAAQRSGSSGPMLVILCGKGNTFDQFLTGGDRIEADRYNSVFLEDTEVTAIVVDFAAQDLYVTGAGPITVNEETGQVNSGGREEADPFRAFRVAYFRHLLRRSVKNAPEWFEEGLVQLSASVDYTKDWIEFGKVGDGFGASKVGDFNQIMARRGLMKLSKMFAGRDALDADERYVWQSQCYLFVHMCLYGLNGKYQKPLIQLIDRSTKEPLTEALFKECFKRSFNDIEIEMRGYIEFTVHKYTQWEAKKGQGFQAPAKVDLRAATDAEVGRMKGEALRLAGNKTESRAALIAPYIRGERDPQLLASLGLTELDRQDQARARKFLEAAFKAGSRRSRANLELARMRYFEVNAASKNGRLDGRQVAEVMQPLIVLRQQPNRMAEVYELAAQTLLAAEGLPTEDVFKFVIEGAIRFPARLRLAYLAAALSVQTEHWTEARALAEHGIRFSQEGSSKEEFKKLAAQIPPPPPPTAATPADSGSKTQGPAPKSDAKSQTPPPKR